MQTKVKAEKWIHLMKKTLMINLEKFSERWKDVKYDSGEVVLNANVCLTVNG